MKKLLVFVEIQVVVFFSVFSVNHIWTQVNTKPCITWQPTTLEVSIIRGTAQIVPIEFQCTCAVTNGTFFIVPELARLASLGPPTSPVTIPPGRYSVSLRIDAITSLDQGSYKGTIHMRSGTSTIASPLPVLITITLPSQVRVPSNISTTSYDRIITLIDGRTVVKDQLLVGLFRDVPDPDTVILQIARSSGARITGSIPELRIYELYYENADPDFLDRVRQPIVANPDVKFATLSWAGTITSSPPPNDEQYWIKDWVHPRGRWDEASPEGSNWALEYIQALSAWDSGIGDRKIGVAVIDTAFGPHEDFEGNVAWPIRWIRDPTSQGDHGTAVAGVIGAVGNNKIGVTGVAQRCTMRLYEVNPVGCGVDSDGKPKQCSFRENYVLAQGVADLMFRAVREGARIVNLSIGFEAPPGIDEKEALAQALGIRPIFQNVIEWARDYSKNDPSKTVLWIFAAGNSRRDAKLMAPANLSRSYDANTKEFGDFQTDVITVAAVGYNRHLWMDGMVQGSNKGPLITVAAPGEHILTTGNVWLPFPFRCASVYRYVPGTSVAAPHVAGLAVLIISKYPGKTAAQVRECIVSSANRSGKVVETEGSEVAHSFRVINAYEAVKCNQPPTAGFLMGSGSQSATEGQTLNLRVPMGGTATVAFSADRSSDLDGTVFGWEWKIDGTVVSTASAFSTGLSKGTRDVTLVVTDDLGAKSIPAQGTIVVMEVAPPNQPPTAGFSMTSGSQSATEGQTLNLTVPPGADTSVVFSADRSSDTDGTVVGWEWKIDSAVASTAQAFTLALGVGSHPVSLVVRDNLGATSQPAQATIAVSERSDFATGAYPDAITVGDFNQDGKLDIATSNHDGMSASVLINQTPPGGTVPLFAPNSPQRDLPLMQSGQGIVARDLNSDGTTDLAVNSAGACSTAAVFLNNSVPGSENATFGPRQDFDTGSNAADIASADLDGDGKPDLAVVNQNIVCSTGFSVSMLLNGTSPRSSAATFSVSDLRVGYSPLSVAIGDLNEDSRPDLVVGIRDCWSWYYGPPSVSVFFNTTSPGATIPSFAQAGSYIVGSGCINSVNVALADINGDGRVDLIASNSDENTVSVFTNQTPLGASQATFAPKVDLLTGASPVKFAATDLNGDGRPDLVAPNFGSNTISILTNTTPMGGVSPTFSPRIVMEVGQGPHAVAIGDFNADGIPDIAVANALDSTVSVLLGRR